MARSKASLVVRTEVEGGPLEENICVSISVLVEGYTWSRVMAFLRSFVPKG